VRLVTRMLIGIWREVPSLTKFSVAMAIHGFLAITALRTSSGKKLCAFNIGSYLAYITFGGPGCRRSLVSDGTTLIVDCSRVVRFPSRCSTRTW
jgi:hypothetical protein